MEVIVRMHIEDLAAFTNVAKRPFTVAVQSNKPKVKQYPPTESLKKVICQRIIDYVLDHPGCLYSQIRRNVRGSEGVIVSEIKGLRQEGLLIEDEETRGFYVGNPIDDDQEEED
jgi:hypothetical protein